MSNNSDDSMDMTQFYSVFFEEAAEHLDGMESLLLEIDLDAADEEQLNAIFRAAHSIKGGAATFGFQDITGLTHEMETVFDRVRKGQMPLSTGLVDAFLTSGDMLKSMLAARRGDGAGVQQDDVDALCRQLRAFLELEGAEEAALDQTGGGNRPVMQTLELVFAPLDDKFSSASVDAVVVDLKDFGALEELPGLAGAERRFRIVTEVSAADLADTIAFMADPERVKVNALESAAVSVPASAVQAGAGEPGDKDFGLFVDESSLPANDPQAAGKAPVGATVVKMKGATKPPSAAGAGDSASIRVSVEKVDQLINLVGELVITQAMLAQTASNSDPVLYEALFNGLAQLQRNTRDLQESAMSIRMMPMSFVFSRFPRVVRDVAAKLGKDVELHTVGEGTELDKGLIERIVDPLTHLVRNSLDHGLEAPDERVAKGKASKGTITLRAYHQGGAIVIEVSDDGRGLRRDKILAKAKERGMAVSDAMSDQEVWQLIFEAGFSTADQITDVSGRGVGMDVVRRNIQEMGGRVEIDSAPDLGTRISIKLPLTLAILDGMSVRVGGEVFIIPLSYISESLQPKADAMRSLQGNQHVVAVRGDYLPVLSLAQAFNVRAEVDEYDEGILVIIESEGAKTALFVDGLVGQNQVVIKSLENNYRKVAGISGATIMGDGRVAMIVDVAYLVGLANSRLDKAA
jgi:two-component system chemotaxis sensor kinase CheA